MLQNSLMSNRYVRPVEREIKDLGNIAYFGSPCAAALGSREQFVRCFTHIEKGIGAQVHVSGVVSSSSAMCIPLFRWHLSSRRRLRILPAQAPN